MLKLTLVFTLMTCLFSESNQAQTNSIAIDTLLIGIWYGSSICQIKNSPCHDESVVYHISKNKGIDTFYVNANKIVNHKEEEMGVLPFVYDTKTNQFISTAYGLWTFNIEGSKLEGTLLVRGELYRKIVLHKKY